MVSWKKQKEIKKQKILDKMIYPWSQQPGESDNDYSLFIRYLSIGRTRSYAKVSESSEISYTTICRVANKQNWKSRADKHDIVKEEEFKTKLDEEIMLSRIRQQRIASSMSLLAEKGINMLNKNIEELSPSDCARLLDVAVKVENLALGASTEITKSKIDSKVEVVVEKIDPKIIEEVGKLIAIKNSKDVGND
jgi:hypothetical protein